MKHVFLDGTISALIKPRNPTHVSSFDTGHVVRIYTEPGMKFKSEMEHLEVEL